MSDEVWASIERKMRGQHKASYNLPTSCTSCGDALVPVDFGVDPQENERLWVTSCCGRLEKYLEVLGPRDLI